MAVFGIVLANMKSENPEKNVNFVKGIVRNVFRAVQDRARCVKEREK